MSDSVIKPPDYLKAVAAKPKRIQGNPVWMVLEEGQAPVQKVLPIQDMERYLEHLIRTDLAGDYVARTSNGAQISLPKYGEYSLLLKSIPHVIYDAPDLMGLLGANACTDFNRVWWCAPFVYRLMKADEHGDRSLAFVALHEVGHILLAHNRRLKGEPPLPWASDAIETENNSKLIVMMKDVVANKDILDMVRKNGVDDAEKWAALSAEEIQSIYYAERGDPEKKQQQQPGQGQGQPSQNQKGQGQQGQNQQNPQQGQGGQSQQNGAGQQKGQPQQGKGQQGQQGQGNGQPQPGQSQGQGQGQAAQGQGQPQSGQGQGQGQKSGQPQPGQGQGGAAGPQPGEFVFDMTPGSSAAQSAASAIDDFLEGNGHSDQVSEEDVSKAMSAGGYDAAMKALNVPQPRDEGHLERNRRLSEARVQRSMQEGRELRKKAEDMGVKFPGAHMDDFFAESLSGITNPKMRWKMMLRRLVIGSGRRVKFTDRSPTILAHVSPHIMGVKDRIYIGKYLPHAPKNKLDCIVDTSGSCDNRMLRLFFSEIYGLVRNTKKANVALSVYHADTVVRGEAEEINPKNWRKMIGKQTARGRGGTDFLNAILHTIEKEKKNKTWKDVDAILYFTDLYDSPPAKEQLPKEKLPPIIFICPPGHGRKEFAQSVSSFASVLEIDGTPVDLERMAKEIAAENGELRVAGEKAADLDEYDQPDVAGATP